MNIEQIQRRLANGFKPFTLGLSDGGKLSVALPEFLALGRRVMVVIGQDDRVGTLDPAYVVSIEEKPAGS